MSDLIQANLVIIGDSIQGAGIDELLNKMEGNYSDKAKGIFHALCYGLLTPSYSRKAMNKILELAENDLNQSRERIKILSER
jgi:hypothetical protein